MYAQLSPWNDTIWKAAVFMLLMGVIYEVHRWDGLRWNDILTKFHEYRLGNWANITIVTSVVWMAAVLVLLIWRIYDVRVRVELGWDDII